MAHYSSLFTLGLLSDRASPPSSPKANIFYKFRKSSLPTRALSNPTTDVYAAPPSETSAPNFTDPFAASSPVSEASNELRSFLSLDLAADRNLNSSKLLSPLESIVSPTSQPHHPLRTVSSSSWQRSAPLSLPTRTSRDSLRTLPSPRPAPSSALPDVPSERKEPRTLAPIFIPSPSLFPPASSSTRPAGRGSPTSHRAPLSAPPVPVTARPPSSSSNISLPTPSPASPLSSPSFRSTRLDSFMSLSSAGTMTSTRTSRRRNAERSNALACLEGRSRAPGRVPRSVRQRNFMSMSDDEDEVARDDEAAGDADVEDDSDAPERPQPTPPRSSPPLPSPGRRPHKVTRERTRCPVDEEEDRVLPPPASNFQYIRQQRTSSSSSVSKAKSRSRRGTLESWFPLANFIDLKDDELQGWRGVVEIVNGL